MKKKKLILGTIFIFLVFIGLVLLQRIDDDVKGDFSESFIASIKGSLIKETNISVNNLSNQLSGSGGCNLKKQPNGRYRLVIQENFPCTAVFPKDTNSIIRRLPKLVGNQGNCLITLQHYNNKDMPRPEEHKLNGPVKKELTLSLFEGGGKLRFSAQDTTQCYLYFKRSSN